MNSTPTRDMGEAGADEGRDVTCPSRRCSCRHYEDASAALAAELQCAAADVALLGEKLRGAFEQAAETMRGAARRIVENSKCALLAAAAAKCGKESDASLRHLSAAAERDLRAMGSALSVARRLLFFLSLNASHRASETVAALVGSSAANDLLLMLRRGSGSGVSGGVGELVEASALAAPPVVGELESLRASLRWLPSTLAQLRFRDSTNPLDLAPTAHSHAAALGEAEHAAGGDSPPVLLCALMTAEEELEQVEWLRRGAPEGGARSLQQLVRDVTCTLGAALLFPPSPSRSPSPSAAAGVALLLNKLPVSALVLPDACATYTAKNGEGVADGGGDAVGAMEAVLRGAAVTVRRRAWVRQCAAQKEMQRCPQEGRHPQELAGDGAVANDGGLLLDAELSALLDSIDSAQQQRRRVSGLGNEMQEQQRQEQQVTTPLAVPPPLVAAAGAPAVASPVTPLCALATPVGSAGGSGGADDTGRLLSAALLRREKRSRDDDDAAVAATATPPRAAGRADAAGSVGARWPVPWPRMGAASSGTDSQIVEYARPGEGPPPGLQEECAVSGAEAGRCAVLRGSPAAPSRASTQEASLVSAEAASTSSVGKDAAADPHSPSTSTRAIPSRLTFQISPEFDKEARAAVAAQIRNLGGAVDARSHYSVSAGLLVVLDPRASSRREKILCYRAARKPIVPLRYVTDSLAAGQWLVNRLPEYDATAGCCGGEASPWSERRARPAMPLPFARWRVLLFVNSKMGGPIERVLRAGGCESVVADPRAPERFAAFASAAQLLDLLLESQHSHEVCATPSAATRGPALVRGRPRGRRGGRAPALEPGPGAEALPVGATAGAAECVLGEAPMALPEWMRGANLSAITHFIVETAPLPTGPAEFHNVAGRPGRGQAPNIPFALPSLLPAALLRSERFLARAYRPELLHYLLCQFPREEQARCAEDPTRAFVDAASVFDDEGRPRAPGDIPLWRGIWLTASPP